MCATVATESASARSLEHSGEVVPTLLPAVTNNTVTLTPTDEPADADDVLGDDDASLENRAFYRDSACFLASSIVHLLALILLALIEMVSDTGGSSVMALTVMSSDGVDSEELEPTLLEPTTPDDLADMLAKPEDVTADESQALADSQSIRDALDDAASELSVELVKNSELQIEPTPVQATNAPSLDPDESLGLRAAGSRSVITQIESTMRTAVSPEQAVSGLGGDIAGQLAQGDVLVVWLFDASLSMKEDRRRAAQHMTKVFKELDERSKGRPYQHHESLMYFGHNWVRVVPPTRDWAECTRAAGAIPDDETGLENLFAALQHAIPEYREKWSGALRFVVWTDESANDAAYLEETVALCQREKVAVSVVGPTAVLGRSQGLQFFRHDARHAWWIEVDKGPDAWPYQLIQMPHWGSKAREANVMSSGFGPYALVRLSQATGGTFTNYDRLADRGSFKLADLAGYEPDYRDPTTITLEIRQNPLRQAIADAVQISARDGVFPAPILTPQFGVWLSAGVYQQQVKAIVARDLQQVQRMAPRVEEAYARLSADERVTQLDYEKSPRWRANYQLARGRLAALTVRFREYEILAERILDQDALHPTTNQLSIELVNDLRSESWGRDRASDSRRWLELCAKEHAKTPWGEIAKAELAVPLGLRLQQGQIPQPRLIPGGPMRPGRAAPGPPRL